MTLKQLLIHGGTVLVLLAFALPTQAQETTEKTLQVPTESLSETLASPILESGTFRFTASVGQPLGMPALGLLLHRKHNTNTEHLTAEVPEHFTLAQNYPNPFNPTTQIDFTLAEASPVELVVFDVLGRQVAVLVEGSLSAGVHQVQWQALDVPSGVYFYRLVAGERFSETRQMLLMK